MGENEIKERVLKELSLRSGLTDKEQLLETFVRDSMNEIKCLFNYEEKDELPVGCIPAVKALTLTRYNQDGTEGIQSETQSAGGNTTYVLGLPDVVKQAVRRYRKFRRR